MSALITILRAVHCRSTHHFFAIDALERLNTPNGRRLATVLLANYGEYLAGAKAPDTKFKDFQNHVLHVSDNNWGGAPQACEKWLAQIIIDMHESDWKMASYGLGVLSHYFTDPLMPLHTAQHPSEAAVHRALEWSVCKSYDWIYRKCTGQVQFPIDTGPRWISKAVLAGAAIAHPHYLTLIEHYDLNKGVKDPKAGLDFRSREILTEIFDYTLTGWANILDRIAALALVEIPICPLTFTTVMAAVDVPAAWVVSRVTDATEQRAVKAIFDEYQATGQVVRNLSPELKAIESLKPPAAPANTSVTAKAPVQAVVQAPPPVPVLVIEPKAVEPKVEPKVETQIEPQAEPQVVPPAQPAVVASQPTLPPPVPEVIAKQQLEQTQSTARQERPERTARVTLESDIVDAPSIGPKTAARFYQIGIETIGEFLAADPAEMAHALDANWMDEQVLRNWQDQARLVVQVPALCGYKSQLLVGVHCRLAEELAGADAASLHQAISRYAATVEGARILRSAAVPSVEEVAKWITSAAGGLSDNSAQVNRAA